MKYLALFTLIGLIFIACGFVQVSNYSISLEGPLSQEGLPELFYEQSGKSFSIQPEVLESKPSQRNITYKFHLYSGIYNHLSLARYDSRPPSMLSIHNYRDQEVATLTAPLGSFIGATIPFTGQVSLPPPNIFSLVIWFIENMWIWLSAIIIFLIIQKPVRIYTRSLLAIPASQLRFGKIDGKAVLLTLIAITTVWLSLGIPGAIRFDNDDDPAMQMLADGTVTGHPSEYLIFINVLIGLLLKSLYLLAPQVCWYPLCLLSIVLFCLAGITFLLLRDDVFDRFCWLCLFGIVFGTYFVTHLQFTSTAYLLGLLGMLIFSQQMSRNSLILAIILVAAGSLIRFESFLLLLLTTIGAAWFLSRRKWQDKAIFVVTVLSLALAGKAFDNFYYDRHADWQAYRHYNISRGGLHMTPKLNFNEGNQEAYNHVSWSKNDFDMFSSHWLFQDSAAFSADKLAYLNQHLSPNVTSLSVLFKIITAIYLAPSAVLLFLVILFHKVENPRQSLRALAVVVGPPLIVLCYLVLTARVPARVFVPVLYATSLFLLVALREDGETCRRLASRHFLPLLFVTLMVLSLVSGWTEVERNNREAKRLETSLKQLVPYSDKTLACSILSIKLQRLDPFATQTTARKLNLIHLMWSGESPSFKLQLQRYGSTSLFQSLASDPNFWLMIPTSQWDRAACFSRYMQEHYHQKIKMVPVILADGRPAIFPDFSVMKAVPDEHP
ncbi:MAG: hypothetical protein LV479_02565 [Methylacidiphilales bacterium]|nr:hypothetical protein [Candidatus Methylacidiphilales bacterium]